MIPDKKLVAVRAQSVSKFFLLPHLRIGSVKKMFLGLFSKKNREKKVATQRVLHDVSFEIYQGEFFGIVGRNGSGKSTLLKIIAGIYEPTKGHIEVSDKVVPFIELGVGFNGELTGRENVYLNGALLGYSRQQIDAKLPEILDFSELKEFIDQKLKNYSSGMQVRLAFSIATRLSQSDIMIIDEVLAVGDADFQRKCFDYFKQLKKRGTTVILVTHDMSAVIEFCDRAMLIEKSKVVAIGKPRMIAHKYADLFMDETTRATKGQSVLSKRRGTHDIFYDNVNAVNEGESIIVNATVKSSIDADEVLYGIHIIAADGTELTAVNNRLINIDDITNIRSGDTLDLVWKIQNIFSDGNYTVTLSLADPVSLTYDWYEDCAAFSVKRRERSVTPILPPINVSVGKV